MTFEITVENFIAKHHLMRKSDSVLVALSGGADSVALLLVLQKLGFNVAAAHCNFHLRGEESDRDERFVRNLCKKAGVPLHIEQFDTNAEAARNKESIEMAARRLRYEWFSRLRSEHGYDCVAVAHHRDDNAETFFLNLLRGTSVRGLAGMRPKRDKIVRPLLCVGRKDIENWLILQNQSYVTDSTNSDTNLRRNKIRHEVLPLLRSINPSFEKGLAMTMQRLYITEATENSVLIHKVGRLVSILNDGISINVSMLQEEPFAETILFHLMRIYGFPPAISEELMERLDKTSGDLYKHGDFLLSRNPRQIEIRRHPVQFDEKMLHNGNNLMPDGSVIDVSEIKSSDIPVPDEQDKHAKRFSTPPEVAYIDRDKIEGHLVCRSIRSGDKFKPFGMRGSKLINDFLTEKGYSRIDRIATKVVCDRDKVLWVVGARTAGYCAVSDETEDIVRLELIQQ